jgi:hypothetical protein
MNLKMISKKNIGFMITLLLSLLLTQSKVFSFFVNKYLGRTFLVLILIYISYLNNILGIVSVLLIIIMFSNYDVKMLEGLEGLENKENKTEDTEQTEQPKQPKQTEQTELMNTPKEYNIEKKTELPENASIEGFDLVSAESNIQKGKQSNSIPVFSFSRQSDEVLPYDKSDYSSSITI